MRYYPLAALRKTPAGRSARARVAAWPAPAAAVPGRSGIGTLPLLAGSARAGGAGVTRESILGLQRAYGNRAVERLIQRQLSDQAQPGAFANCEAFNSEPRLVACLGSGRLRPGDQDKKDQPIYKVQKALTNAGYQIRDSEKGIYGSSTGAAVLDFKRTKLTGYKGPIINDIGPLTVKTLAENYCPASEPPVPPPAKAVLDPPQCDPGGKTASVTGRGFPPNSVVALSIAGMQRNEAVTDPGGVFHGAVYLEGPAPGSQVIRATSGSTLAFVQINLPCSGPTPPKPTPDPNLVTQSELLVLTKYQFLGQAERDATEDAIKDIRNKLDKTPVSWDRALAGVIGGMIIQFVYGGFEGVLLAAIASKFLDKGTQDIVKQGADKASDMLEDNGKDGYKKAIEEEEQQPTRAVEDQIESFRRSYLKGLRKAYIALETGWITKVWNDPKAATLTAEDWQNFGMLVDSESEKMYKTRYTKTIEGWASYIAQRRVGQSKINIPGKGVQSVTNLASVGDRDPKDVPGVLLVGLRSPLPDGRSLFFNVTRVYIDKNDVHIFGLSETTRHELARTGPELGSLNVPVVFRGKSDGDLVAIGKNELGGTVDAGSETKGKAWLAAVGQWLRGNPAAGDRAVFEDYLSGATIERIQGP